MKFKTLGQVLLRFACKSIAHLVVCSGSLPRSELLHCLLTVHEHPFSKGCEKMEKLFSDEVLAFCLIYFFIIRICVINI